MIRIDGSYGEGGGQIIRTSLSLAVLTGQAVEIENVRAGRERPGLQPQHLMAVHAAAALCGATLTGDSVGSQHLRFQPQSAVNPGHYRFDIGTAGATPLVVQTVLLPLTLAGAPSQVRVTGGTHVPFAPPVEYLQAVYLPALRRAGVDAGITYERAGFYPRGGGEVVADITPSVLLRPVDFTERGALLHLRAFVLTSGLPAHVGERGQAAMESFMRGIGQRCTIQRYDKPSHGPGAAVVIAAECAGGFAGFSGLGARGKPMEVVAQEACADFLRWWQSDAACDEHLADQLVLPMALAAGESNWTAPVATDHLHTVLSIAAQFLQIEYEIREKPGAPVRVMLHSAGFVR